MTGRRNKFSLTMLLVQFLGVLFMMEVFVWVIENKVFKGEAEVPIKELHIAVAVVSVLLALRVAYVLLKIRMNQGNNPAFDTSRSNENSQMSGTCMVCGKTVSEKVKAYCRNHPEKFHNQVYCYDHQRNLGG